MHPDLMKILEECVMTPNKLIYQKRIYNSKGSGHEIINE
jgi:hypothetical protein